jgi:hypothetical protein
MRKAGALLAGTGLVAAAGFWLWIALSLPFDDQDLQGCGGGPLWFVFQTLQKALAAAGTIAAFVCLAGAVRFAAVQRGLMWFGYGGAVMSFTFFGWILLMGIVYTWTCG